MTISTQKFLEIRDIKQGMLILKDNNIRGVLMVSSINFSLKSREEKEAIIYQFQNFLNSLDFTIQIITQTRKLNITSYLDKLMELEAKQTNELLKIQTIEYRKFIKQLVIHHSIMAKYFYIIVPYYLFETERVQTKKKRESSVKKLTEQEYKRMGSQLKQRVLFVASGIEGCGVSVSLLNTSQLIDLFWSNHHPLQAEQGHYPEVPDELII